MEGQSFIQLKDKVIQALKTIYDPEIPVDIYELGLIYEVNVSLTNEVHILMTLTSPACPVAGSLPQEVEDTVKELEGVEKCEVEMTFDPPWNKDFMSETAQLELGFM